MQKKSEQLKKNEEELQRSQQLKHSEEKSCRGSQEQLKHRRRVTEESGAVSTKDAQIARLLAQIEEKDSCWSIYDDRTSCAEISPFLWICDRVVFEK